ncbi:Crp/Fnr family transcriptional regulator [Sphingomonas sp.]
MAAGAGSGGAEELRATVAMVLRCGVEVAALLVDAGRVRRYGRRETLARQGDAVATLWLVIEGRVKIESSSAAGRSSQLALHGPGDWVGQYARACAAVADVVVVEPAVLLGFAAGVLPGLAERHAELGAALAASFARQLEAVTARLDARSTLTARGRICAELLARAGAGLVIAPPPVVAELAHAAQTTRETASRMIAELERRGIVVRDAAELRISSPRLLSDLVI